MKRLKVIVLVDDETGAESNLWWERTLVLEDADSAHYLARQICEWSETLVVMEHDGRNPNGAQRRESNL